MSRVSIIQAISFFIYLFYQVLILKNIVLFNTAFCFLYVAYLFFLPVDSNPLLLMVAGFLMGLTVDMFYDSLGLHAFACVFVITGLYQLLPRAAMTPMIHHRLLRTACNGFWFTLYR